MRNLFLSVALIALPVGAFAAVEILLPRAPADTQAAAGLGDVSRYQAIVTDVRKSADSGDLAAAETRVTDFETLWDQEEPSLRPIDKAGWARIDTAADAAFKALRDRHPQAGKVDAALAGLSAALDHGGAGAPAAGAVVTVAGVAVTDETGHPIPCEEMLRTLRTAVAAAKPGDSKTIADFEAKGTERCNADDDGRADAFFAQGIALAKG